MRTQVSYVTAQTITFFYQKRVRIKSHIVTHLYSDEKKLLKKAAP